VAAGGEEAVRMVLDLRPDLVLMDIALEGIDGLETIRRIRAVAPGARVIVVSALAQESVREQAQGLRLDGLLTKPFTTAELKSALEAGHG
jgi:CheY-like chemotaxis protein